VLIYLCAAEQLAASEHPHMKLLFHRMLSTRRSAIRHHDKLLLLSTDNMRAALAGRSAPCGVFDYASAMNWLWDFLGPRTP
jgi:hypothetical protein